MVSSLGELGDDAINTTIICTSKLGVHPQAAKLLFDLRQLYAIDGSQLLRHLRQERQPPRIDPHPNGNVLEHRVGCNHFIKRHGLLLHRVCVEKIDICEETFLAAPEALVRVVTGIIHSLVPPRLDPDRAKRLIRATNLHILERYTTFEEARVVPSGTALKFALAADLAAASN